MAEGIHAQVSVFPAGRIFCKITALEKGHWAEKIGSRKDDIFFKSGRKAFKNFF